MRRTAWLTAALVLAGLHAVPARAQGLPPHAWLFGAWTGGIFPPPSSITAQECLAMPVVIFTRDIVMRAVITDQFLAQRLVETARVTPEGTEFRFVQQASPAGSSPFTLGGSGGEVGFGCISPDALRVQRRTENEISFPGCTDFPYPLVRCPAR
ncbi:MAG TPA: hypothetical protein VFE12_07650 [Acetobacteraceae bacterium]|jgi:hypothetical protein|nr:hypothetical protein [Acetobacteraceae bacterium]